MNRERGFLTPKEVGDALFVSAPTVRKWIRQGKLSAYTIPSEKPRIRVRVANLIAFCQANEIPLDTVFVRDRPLSELVEEDT